MEWFITCPDDKPAAPFYVAWLALAGIAGRLMDGNFTHPGDLGNLGGLLLAGGPDVAPERYGDKVRHAATYGVDPARDDLELRLCGEFLAAGKPVFGICRGIQLLNVALGGGLLQHVPDVLGAGANEGHANIDGIYPLHALRPDTTTRFGRVLAEVKEVNTSHHQAVDPARIGRGLHIAAYSGLGIIEAVELTLPGTRVYAVQWHPERLPPDHIASRTLIEQIRCL